MRRVEVGREDLDAHAVALGNEDADFVGVVDFVGEQRGHELDRMVRLQPCGPIRDVAVAGGVGFVEAVAGEHLDLVENLAGELFPDVVGCGAALDEIATFLRHFRRVLLAHRAAQQVGTAERVAGEQLGGVLHLFLIDHHAVGVAADGLQQRVLVGRLLAAFFHLDHLVDELHRARPVEGEQVDDVIDLLDLVFAAGFDHAAGFELEHAHRLAAVEDLEGPVVVERDLLDFEIRLALADVADGFLDDGEVFQPEEVHLQQAHLGDRAHVILGDHLALVATGQRDVFVERAVADDDAGGVDADVAVDAFQLERVVPQLAIGGGGFDKFAQFRLGIPLALESDAGFRLDHLGDAVGVAIGNAHHAGDIADDAFRAERAVGDDVGDAAVAVFVSHVVDHLGAARLAEVDIDVGRADAFRVEEALEEQSELERADVGDAHGVGDERTRRRAAAGADRDVLVARPLDEIRGDEEVGREAEVVDGIDLVFQPLLDFGIGGFFRAVAFDETFLADAHEVLLARRAVGRLELRVFLRRGGIELDLDIAAVGDFERGIAGSRHLGEDGAHFLRRLEMHLGRVAHAVLVDEQAAGADADHHVVRLVVCTVEEMHVVGGHRLEAEFRSELEQRGSDAALRFEVVVVDLDVGVFAAEDLDYFGQRFAGLVLVAGEQPFIDRTRDAAGEADDALGELAQGLAIDPRLAVVEAIEMAHGHQL